MNGINSKCIGGAVACALLLNRLILFLIFMFVHPIPYKIVATPPLTQLLGIKLKLIHRNSILSPVNIYNINGDNSDARADLIPDFSRSLFLVNVSVGHPPLPQLLAMDTGSSFIWFQCLPCNCFHHVNPIFDPSKSSTYRHIYCDQHRHIICEYSHTYSDHTTTIGTLAREDLTLVTSDQGTTTIQDVVVGCGHNNSGTLDPLASGILGLGGNDKSSLLYHIGGRNPKFSYCIGNLSDPYYEYNHLIIGDGAIIQGYSTPIQVVNGLYYLTLQGISLGEMSLPINPNIFKRAPLSGHSGVIIDSGTTLIYLHRLGFEALKAQVRSLIGGLLQQVTSQNYPDWFCYRGDSIKQQLREFPALTFHFEGGADLVLESDAMFTKASVGVFCLSVVPSDNPYPNLSIIGIKAQQYYNMAYDLDAMKLYFQRIDCELLED